MGGRSTRHREAVELFVHRHRDRPTPSTPLCCCAPNRGRTGCTAKLIADVCASDILDDDALDALADRLLWPDRPAVRRPLSWLGLEWLSIDVASGEIVSRGVDHDRLVDHQRSPAEPPLLRWAAGHLLRRKRTTLDQLRNRAASLDSRGGPAVLAGALDTADSLTRSDLRTAIESGLKGGRGQVRKVALQVHGRTGRLRRGRPPGPSRSGRVDPPLGTDAGDRERHDDLVLICCRCGAGPGQHPPHRPSHDQPPRTDAEVKRLINLGYAALRMRQSTQSR